MTRAGHAEDFRLAVANSAEDTVAFTYHDACTVWRKSNDISPWYATLAHDGIHAVE